MKFRSYLALFIFLVGLFFFAGNKVSITGAYIGASNPGSMVGIFLMMLSSFVYLSKKGRSLNKIESSINDDSGLVRLANEATKDQTVQRDLDNMVAKLQKGYEPGEIKGLPKSKNIKYAKSRNGARLFFRETSKGIEIVGKSSKKNEQKVIDRLRSIYGD